jgi:hypothetical protein
VRTIPNAERRARLARRHGFAQLAPSVPALAGQMAGLHSTDPVSVYLSLASRRVVDTPEGVDIALYEERSSLRMLGMRRTLFVVPVDLISAVQRSYTDGFVAKECKRFARWLEHAGITDDGESHIDRMFGLALSFLEQAGEASTREMTAALPELDQRFVPPVGPRWATPISVGSRVIHLLTASGMAARVRPLGTWISSQYRYAPLDRWLGAPIAALDEQEARNRLALAWLSSFGPGTVTDLKWWTGWTLGHTRRTLEALGTVEVALESGTGHVLADDIEPVEPVDPWAGLLPSLDPTSMGWKERDWYLGEHAHRLFDRNGNAGPTVWWDGRVVGGWAQRSDGEIVVEYLEDVGADAKTAVKTEVARLVRFLGPTRFTPRFPTPLEHHLRTAF